MCWRDVCSLAVLISKGLIRGCEKEKVLLADLYYLLCQVSSTSLFPLQTTKP